MNIKCIVEYVSNLMYVCERERVCSLHFNCIHTGITRILVCSSIPYINARPSPFPFPFGFNSVPS